MIYLARISGTKEFVGVFSAPTVGRLFWLVDECTDPFACEVLPVSGAGGIYALGIAGVLDPSDDEAPDALYANDIRRAGGWQELPPDSAWKRFETHEKFKRAA